MSDSQFQIHQIDEESSQKQDLYQKPRKQMVYSKGTKEGKWETDQIYKYFAFLQFLDSKNHFKKGKIMFKVFKTMAVFVGTRNLLQCRSFHQKMERKYGGIKTILRKGLKAAQRLQYAEFQSQKRSQIEILWEACFSNSGKNKGFQELVPRPQTTFPNENLQPRIQALEYLQPNADKHQNEPIRNPIVLFQMYSQYIELQNMFVQGPQQYQ